VKSKHQRLLEQLLAWQLKRLLNKNNPTVVAVVGSVGKTSTKLAIATVLKTHMRVRYQEGNYNVPLTVPLVFFAQSMPSSLLNIIAWCLVLLRNERMLLKKYPYDAVVVEYGIDKPGEMNQLLALARPDITVLTAISYEHMENFESLEHVASEELLAVEAAKKVAFVCKNSVAAKFVKASKNCVWYGVGKGTIRAMCKNSTVQGSEVTIALPTQQLQGRIQLFGAHNITAAAAAAAVANECQVPPEKITEGLENIRAFAGRMNVLRGRQYMTLLDDTYNASPEAVLRALDTVYASPAAQKIAVLGSMNELGGFSEESHKKVGAYCKKDQLYEVVTIGAEAEKYLAPAAEKAGCRVKSFMDPFSAGEYVKSIAYPKALILYKGSQNGVFAEEAIKPLLLQQRDSSKLVRQSDFWMRKKYKQFGY
jgi:UDP-N-acetylmuramoyl-tripeptide--D-alanyl-D-alanine ligase